MQKISLSLLTQTKIESMFKYMTFVPVRLRDFDHGLEVIPGRVHGALRARLRAYDLVLAPHGAVDADEEQLVGPRPVRLPVLLRLLPVVDELVDDHDQHLVPALSTLMYMSSNLIKIRFPCSTTSPVSTRSSAPWSTHRASFRQWSSRSYSTPTWAQARIRSRTPSRPRSSFCSGPGSSRGSWPWISGSITSSGRCCTQSRPRSCSSTCPPTWSNARTSSSS